ncbi:hypothetical protein [Micromonospora sp. NPDC047074]|uniref:hypothetical protein n=1 Tax=Micromonospora sp. NPDC047074 TaxID=3154339 RepID=UPI0033EC34B9
MQRAHRGLAIRCATEDEATRIGRGIAGHLPAGAHVLILESEGVTGHVVTLAVGWSEGVLSDLQPSLFNTFSPYNPVWPTAPLAGVDGELDIASPQAVAEVFRTGLAEGVRRKRHRHVHVLTAVTELDGRRTRHNLGVFLTEADAEEARRLIEPDVASCWVEPLPMVF